MAEEGKELVVQTSMFLDATRFEFAQRVAKVFAESTMVPEQFRGKLGNCLIALNLADRLHVDPFMMMQTMYVVKGRPGIEGKLVKALVDACGRFEPLDFETKESGKLTSKKVPRPDSCVAFAKETKSGKVLKGPVVTWEMVEAEHWNAPKGSETSKWETMPEVMFMYRAATFFARVHCPGVTLGMRTAEELDDSPPVESRPGAGGVYAVAEAEPPKTFADLLPPEINKDRAQAFIAWCAEQQKCTVEQVEEGAAKNMTAFVTNFQRWEKDHGKAEEIIAGFVDLKTKGFTEYVRCLTPEEYNSWPQPAQEKFDWKYNRAKTAGIALPPWPPVAGPEEAPPADFPPPAANGNGFKASGPKNEQEKQDIINQATALHRAVGADLFEAARAEAGLPNYAGEWSLEGLRAFEAILDRKAAEEADKVPLD